MVSALGDTKAKGPALAGDVEKGFLGRRFQMGLADWVGTDGGRKAQKAFPDHPCTAPRQAPDAADLLRPAPVPGLCKGSEE